MDSEADCVCTHEAWDHHAIPDPNVSGLLGRCRKCRCQEYREALECLDDYGEGTCEGPVEWHSMDPGLTEAFPRCDKHWEARLRSREESIERYETSDVPPSWFDPADAGETWDDGGW